MATNDYYLEAIELSKEEFKKAIAALNQRIPAADKRVSVAEPVLLTWGKRFEGPFRMALTPLRPKADERDYAERAFQATWHILVAKIHAMGALAISFAQAAGRTDMTDVDLGRAIDIVKPDCSEAPGEMKEGAVKFAYCAGV